MAIFSSKKAVKKTSSKAAQKPAEQAARETGKGAQAADRSRVIKGARITEKATIAQLKNVYVFDVEVSATKRDIAAAFRDQFKVVPAKVSVAKIPRRAVMSRRSGTRGFIKGGKKAYVYLKKGDSISI